MSSRRLPPAGQPDIVLAAQKDQSSLQELRDSVYSVGEGAFGPQATSGAKPELNLLADFLYYFLTISKGRQTLGEEYCDVFYFESDGITRLSKLKRILLAFSLCLGPYFISRLSLGGWSSFISSLRRETARERAAALLRRSQQRMNNISTRSSSSSSYSFVMFANSFLNFLSIASRIHLALFYFRGDYLDPIKRLFGASYMFTREPSMKRPSYWMLSVFIGIQLLLQGGASFTDWISNKENTTTTTTTSEIVVPSLSQDEEEGKIQRNSTMFSNPCGICLSSLKSPACPPCGHIYCFECIVESCIAKSECPLCRRESTPQSVQCVYL